MDETFFADCNNGFLQTDVWFEEATEMFREYLIRIISDLMSCLYFWNSLLYQRWLSKTISIRAKFPAYTLNIYKGRIWMMPNQDSFDIVRLLFLYHLQWYKHLLSIDFSAAEKFKYIFGLSIYIPLISLQLDHIGILPPQKWETPVLNLNILDSI